MKQCELPPVEKLHEFFVYCPSSGVLRWAKKTGKKTVIGARVGSLSGGYLQTSFEGGRYLVHRIAWKLHYGTEPAEIDHINGNRSDNRIENLRIVDRAANTKNKRLWVRNKSGCYGVVAHKHGGWVAQIGAGNRQVYLGYYKKKEDAIKARLEAEKKLGYHKIHGLR